MEGAVSRTFKGGHRLQLSIAIASLAISSGARNALKKMLSQLLSNPAMHLRPSPRMLWMLGSKVLILHRKPLSTSKEIFRNGSEIIEKLGNVSFFYLQFARHLVISGALT